MHIRTPLAVALAATAAALASLPSPATAARKPRLPDCATAGQTLAASATGRVYALRGATFACRYGATKRIRLGSDGECQGDFKPSKPRLTGRYVGWVSTSCNLDASEDEVRVADLLTGRVKWTSVAATGDSATSSRDVTTFVRDFELAANGTAFFVGVFDAGGQTLRVDSPLDAVQLRMIKRNSPDGSEVVDEGQGILAGSLTLTSGGVYYRKDGAPVFAPRPTAGPAAGKATDGAARQRMCSPPRSRTLDATGSARVYRRTNHEIFACGYRTRREVFLGTSDDCLDDNIARQFRLAGRYVAYVDQECHTDGDDETVVVKSIATGERVHAGAAASGQSPEQTGQAALVRALVMNPKGSVAWIGARHVDGAVQVWRADTATGFGGELVDEGADVDLRSLAATADGFYYRKGSTALFVPLR